MQINGFSRLLAVFFALTVACSTLLGQANQGSITGTVRDQTGAVVPSAAIEIKNSATGTTITIGSTETGNYSAPLPTGTYEITISVTGFKKFVQTNIPVVEGSATRRDIALELGAVSDVITVTDTAPMLKTEGGDVSYRVATNLAN